MNIHLLRLNDNFINKIINTNKYVVINKIIPIKKYFNNEGEHYGLFFFKKAFMNFKEECKKMVELFELFKNFKNLISNKKIKNVEKKCRHFF